MFRNLTILLVLLSTSLVAENRTYDGSGNHGVNTGWGAAGEELMRLSPSGYTSSGSPLVRESAPSAREISNGVGPQGGVVGNSRGLSDYIWAWGQFLDHDLDLTPTTMESAPVAVPLGDPIFDPMMSGTSTLGFNRSVHNGREFRDQINEITSWHDSSNIYGSNASHANALRTGSGGRLHVQTISGLDYLPKASDLGLTGIMANEGPPNPELFAAGDIRANEVSSLISLHTIMVREHNRVADLVSANAAALGVSGDEEIYQLARKVVGAEAQAVTYHEYLPTLGVTLSAYGGYDSSVNPNIANEFSGAAFRLGHSQVSSTVLRTNEMGSSVGDLTVANSFFNPQIVLSGGVESILRGLALKEAQEIDTRVVDDLRNLLFGPPPHGTDLMAMNIQRGRDHGLPDYNTMRLALGLGAKASFNELTTDAVLAAQLQSLYGDIALLDPIVGMFAESHLPGSSVGETMHAILADQFQRLRDADRFWYQNDAELLAALPLLGFELVDGKLSRRLAGILLDNSTIGNSGFPIGADTNVFLAIHMPEPGTYVLFACLLLPLWHKRSPVAKHNPCGEPNPGFVMGPQAT